MFIEKKKMALRLLLNLHVMKSEYWTSSRIQRTFAYQETPAVVTDFNQPVEDYLNYIYTCLSAKMMSTYNDGQNSGR